MNISAFFGGTFALGILLMQPNEQKIGKKVEVSLLRPRYFGGIKVTSCKRLY